MKKILSMFMILVLLIGTMAVPALAEGTDGTTDTASSATARAGKDGRSNRGRMPGNGQMPQLPGQNGENSQMPQLPGQNDGNSQMPQLPGQNGENSRNPRTPGKDGRSLNGGMRFGSRNGAEGQQAGRHEDRALFDQLLKDGVITQEIYDAILSYLKEHAPDRAEAASSPEGNESPALPEESVPAENSELPALPDGGQTESAVPEQQLQQEMTASGAATPKQDDRTGEKSIPATEI